MRIILWVLIRLMFHSNLISLVFVYIIVVILFVLAFLANSSRIAPLLFLLLFNRRILVFLIFCILLYNSKFHSSSFHLTISLFMPFIIVNLVRPITIPLISQMFNFYPYLSLILPSSILFLMSISNLELTLRS